MFIGRAVLSREDALPSCFQTKEAKDKHMEVVEKFINVKALAEHLSVAKSFIYKLVSEKRIPFYRIGCRILFKLSEVEYVIRKEMRYA